MLFLGQRAMQYRQPTDFFLINAGYEAVYQREGNLADAVKRLQRYTLAEVLNALTRISVVLNLEGTTETGPERQKYLCQQLFGANGPWVFKAAVESISPEKRVAGILFHDLLLANTAKLALLVLDPDPSFNETKPLEPLGEALLIVSDLIKPATEPVPDPSDEDWVKFFLTNGLFHSGGKFHLEMTRSYDLYLRNRDYLKDQPAHLDLPSLCKRITGLAPLPVWSALFCLLSHWTKADLTSNRVNGHLDFGAYLAQFQLSSE